MEPGRQFTTTRMYHYGALGDEGEASVKARGLLPYSHLHGDHLEDGEHHRHPTPTATGSCSTSPPTRSSSTTVLEPGTQ
jgi:hypothetical protein